MIVSPSVLQCGIRASLLPGEPQQRPFGQHVLEAFTFGSVLVEVNLALLNDEGETSGGVARLENKLAAFVKLDPPGSCKRQQVFV